MVFNRRGARFLDAGRLRNGRNRFTRAKNTGNILMKNLMDFCIGTVMFILIGFSLLLGEDLMGFIGKPGFDIFTAYPNFDFSNFVFNLVFCATTATSSPAQWQSARSSSPTACIPPLFPR